MNVLWCFYGKKSGKWDQHILKPVNSVLVVILTYSTVHTELWWSILFECVHLEGWKVDGSLYVLLLLLLMVVVMVVVVVVVVNKQTSRIVRNRSTLPVCNCSHVMYWHVSYGQVTCWEQSMVLSHDGGTRKVWRNSLTHGSSVSALFTSAHGCQSSHIKTVPCIASSYQSTWNERFNYFTYKSMFLDFRLSPYSECCTLSSG